MKKLLTAVSVVVVLAGGYWYFTTQTANAPGSDAQNGAPAENTGTENVVADSGTIVADLDVSLNTGTGSEAVTVTLAAAGFSPSSVAVKKGQMVTWTNESSYAMWVATGQHPTHTVYGGTSREQHCPDADGNDFDQCAAGKTYSFTFNKAGTWKYHNHSNSAQFGTVVVTE